MSTIETNRSWTHFRVDRRNPRYCHVTFDHPPINTITATTVAELSDLAGLIEQDPDLNVVVFDSANRDFDLAHYDLENDPCRTQALGVGPTAVALGVVDTPMHKDESKDFLKTLQPMGKMVDVTDVVDAVLYLARAPQVSGEVLHVMAMLTLAAGSRPDSQQWWP